MLLKQRFISRDSILKSVGTYEILEEYPHDKYLPSYLVIARYDMDVFHILFATDVHDDNGRVVTAYRPSKEEWCEDMKAGRKPS